MAKAIEMESIEEIVKDSEINIYEDDEQRHFEYNLNEKSAKAKLVKGARRCPLEKFPKSGSLNLVFNPGSWSNVVLPSIRYWDQSKGDKTCKIGVSSIRVVSVKTGTDTGGKHIDTQIVFFINREKAVCHFYNTTQLIMVNGHGYMKLVDEFLWPYFESKIAIHLTDINTYNEQVNSRK